MKPRKTLSAAIIILAMFTIACQLDVPVREMVSAKKKISRAYQVSADRFDPETLKKATDHLLKAHEYLMDEKVDRALDEARLASDTADQAITTSLPLLAAESITAATGQRDRATAADAERYAADDLNLGLNLLNEAETLSGQKDYWSSHLKAREAERIFIRATETSLANRGGLENRRNTIMARRQTMASGPYAAEAEEELNVAAAKLDQTDDAIKTDRLKDANLLLDETDRILDNAQGRIEVRAAQVKAEEMDKKRSQVNERISELRSEIALLRESAGARHAEDDLAAASATLDRATSAVNDDPGAAMGLCDEAALKIEEAKNRIGRAELLDRAAALGERHRNLSADPAAATLGEKLADAESLIKTGSSMAGSGSIDDASAKLDEAGTLLDFIESEMKKIRDGQNAAVTPAGEPGTGEKAAPASGERIYVVKYDPKNRDCLWRISATVYGDARLWPFIYVANRNSIKDPDLIFPGQKLIIPPRPAVRTEAPSAGEKKEDIVPEATQAQ